MGNPLVADDSAAPVNSAAKTGHPELALRIKIRFHF